MNMNECTSDTGQDPLAGVSPGLTRRHFFGVCIPLIGLPVLSLDPRLTAAGPRKLALREADLYRPHTLAG
jgi:hypothetical protein